MKSKYGLVALWGETLALTGQKFLLSLRLLMLPLLIYFVGAGGRLSVHSLSLVFLAALAWYSFTWIRACMLDENPSLIWRSGDDNLIVVRFFRFLAAFIVTASIVAILVAYLSGSVYDAAKDEARFVSVYTAVLVMLFVALASRFAAYFAALAGGDQKTNLMTIFRQTSGYGMEVGVCLALVAGVVIFLFVGFSQQLDLRYYNMTNWLLIKIAGWASLHICMTWFGALVAVQYRYMIEDQRAEGDDVEAQKQQS